MVHLPRDVRPEDLIRVLKSVGFVESRQTGSHITLTHPGPPECHLTIPDHRSISIGVIRMVLRVCESKLGIPAEQILSKL